MDYQKQYMLLIDRAISQADYRESNRQIKAEYYERHHILPICLGGTNEKNNLVLLTAREHFISHLLLCRIYAHANDGIKVKLATALWRMKDQPNKNATPRVKSSRMFALLRKEFSNNHPMKNANIVARMVETQKQNRILNPPPVKIIHKEEFVCICGCNKIGTKTVGKQQNYLHGHNPTNYDLAAETLKKTLSKLSSEELSERSKNSFGNCNHIVRGKNISVAKKGVASNQKEVTGKRLAKLTDEEFELYLDENIKSNSVRKRFTNYRKIYLNNGD